MVERRTLVFEHELLAGEEHPLFDARGDKDGPTLCLLAGIHGCEYSSIAAVIRFMAELDTTRLAGRIVALPVASRLSFEQRSPFVVPADGKNLNRSFPGSFDGTYTDVLARSIFEALIAPADVLVDLHGGDLAEDLEPFSIYVESPVADRAHALAVAFGLPYVVREPAGDALVGMTAGAAAAAGIPGIIAEAGGRGLLEQHAVSLLQGGLHNVLVHLEMLPGEPVEPPPAQLVERFVWLRSTHGGWWEPTVSRGAQVREGQTVGHVRDLWGAVVEVVVATCDGVALFITSSPAVSDDGLLLGLGSELRVL